jgi:hypothetical protein
MFVLVSPSQIVALTEEELAEVAGRIIASNQPLEPAEALG